MQQLHACTVTSQVTLDASRLFVSFQYVESMSGAGATQYTFHVEATSNPGQLIRKIKETGMRVRNHNIYAYILTTSTTNHGLASLRSYFPSAPILYPYSLPSWSHLTKNHPSTVGDGPVTVPTALPPSSSFQPGCQSFPRTTRVPRASTNSSTLFS